MCVALSIEKPLHMVMKDHYVKPYLKYHVLLPSNTRMKITLTFHVLDLHQLTALVVSPFCVFHKVLLLPTYPLSLRRN
jgi:hypothetical protein